LVMRGQLVDGEWWIGGGEVHYSCKKMALYMHRG
jgi:hypothetical protein